MHDGLEGQSTNPGSSELGQCLPQKNIRKLLVCQRRKSRALTQKASQEPDSCCLGANHCLSLGFTLILAILILSPCMLKLEKDASSYRRGL